MKEMKSLKKNQVLTKSEKEEALEMNKELFSLTGTKFKCRTLREYYLIKILYELLTALKETDMDQYYKDILNQYYDKTNVNNKVIRDKLIDDTLEGYYYNYGYTEGLYQYWLKYYYPTVLNFTSFLAIYSGDLLPYTTFINTTNTAFNKLDKFIENQSVEMIRNEMYLLSEITDEYEEELGYKIRFVWVAKKDELTCKICKALNGKEFRYVPDLAHPNCRCTLELKREMRK